MSMTTRAMTVGLGMVAAGLGGCSTGWSESHYHAYVLPLDGMAGSEGRSDVLMRAYFGDVEVAPIGHDWPTQVTKRAGEDLPDGPVLIAIASSQDEERVAGAVSYEPSFRDGIFTVTESWEGGRIGNRGEGTAYFLRLPSIGAVDVTTNFGDVSLIGVHGGAVVDSKFGDLEIVLAEMGNVELQSAHGDIEVYGPAMGVMIRSDFGDVEVAEAHGGVDARTEHGDILVRMAPGNANAFEVTSDFGDVEVVASRSLGGLLVLETDHGDVRFQGSGADGTNHLVKSSDQATVRLGEGPTSRAETDHGDVRVWMPVDG